jgi:hypothetical protein
MRVGGTENPEQWIGGPAQPLHEVRQACVCRWATLPPPPWRCRRLAHTIDGPTVTIIDEIEAFIRDHREHGELVGDATEPAANGYMITVACPCGVTFERWVAPVDATLDLARLARLN